MRATSGLMATGRVASTYGLEARGFGLSNTSRSLVIVHSRVWGSRGQIAHGIPGNGSDQGFWVGRQGIEP